MYSDKAKECSCCWSVGCLCPMPNKVLKISKAFTQLADQNFGFLFQNANEPKLQKEWKAKIAALRFFNFYYVIIWYKTKKTLNKILKIS